MSEISESSEQDPELAAIQAGDAEAFARWMARCEPALRQSLRALATLVDTEAVLQEALLRVWQVAPRFEPDGRPESLLRFSVTIARNLARSELRQRRPDLTEDGELEAALAAVEPSFSPPPDPLLRKRIVECHDKLPGKPKLALDQRLASAGAQSDEVLAARLGMSLNTFLQNFTRARKLLAECLRKKGVVLAEVSP